MDGDFCELSVPLRITRDDVFQSTGRRNVHYPILVILKLRVALAPNVNWSGKQSLGKGKYQVMFVRGT